MDLGWGHSFRKEGIDLLLSPYLGDMAQLADFHHGVAVFQEKHDDSGFCLHIIDRCERYLQFEFFLVELG